MNKIPIYQTLSLSLAFYGSATLTHGQYNLRKDIPFTCVKMPATTNNDTVT